jgi:hypothetical protein
LARHAVQDASRAGERAPSRWGKSPPSRSTALAMNPEQRRALELLAQSPRRCTEDMMMVEHKFEIDVLSKLIGNGLATATT